MNITRQFAQYLEDQGFGTFGTDLYISGVPVDAPDTCLWLTAGGGSNKSKNHTGEKQKNYTINIYYRSLSPEEVYNKLEQIETLVNQDQCIGLTGYELVEAEATSFQTDQDIDNTDRTVGLVQIILTVYL